MKITRRKLAAVLASSAAAPVIVTAQAPASADEETQSAHDQLRTNAETLQKIKIPMATEPPFHFKP